MSVVTVPPLFRRAGVASVVGITRYRLSTACIRSISPGAGSAGKTTTAAEISTEPSEQWFFNQFRLRLWPEVYEGGQFSSDPAALEQFFRAMVPDTGPQDTEVIVTGASAAIDSIGPLVLITHSHAGGFGWLARLRNDNVRAVVSFERGRGFVFRSRR